MQQPRRKTIRDVDYVTLIAMTRRQMHVVRDLADDHQRRGYFKLAVKELEYFVDELLARDGGTPKALFHAPRSDPESRYAAD